MAKKGTLTVITEVDIFYLPIVEGLSVLNVLLNSGLIGISSPCGGNGLCGKCIVREIGDKYVPIHPDEQRILTHDQLSQHYRLACKMMLSSSENITVSLINSKNQINVVSTFQDVSPIMNMRKGFPSPSYGYAIDIGTTTIVVYLVRIDTGEILGHLSSLNPQSFYGGDVITRIQYSSEHANGLKILHEVVVHQLNILMNDLVNCYEIASSLVMEIVAVGNPTMIHLLVGKDPSGIAIAPFIPAFSGPLEIPATQIGCTQFPNAKLFLPGGVSAYVGSDITVGICSSKILDYTNPVLYIDIGTNGEIVLFDGEQLSCCSSAAGPAFEGASIRYGMGAVEGAIDRVWLHENGEVAYSTIAGKPAIGICGSAIIDIMALLIELEIVDETGFMDGEQPHSEKYLFSSNDGIAFRITDSISFTHRDVREVQLAKAAIAAGSAVLLKEAHLEVSELGSVMIAGGFGSFINTQKAKRIGLLPQIDCEKIITIGNAAGRGALDVLLIEGESSNVEHIRTSVHYIELSTAPLFQEYYVEQMFFGEPIH